MQFQYTPVTVPLALAVVLCAVSAVVAWRQRDGEAELWAVVIQVAFGLWALFTLLTFASVSYEAKLYWFLLFIPTIPLSVVATFFFTLHFCGRAEWLTRGRRALVSLFPVAVFGFSLTNGTHGLVVADSWVASGTLRYTWGPAMYATIAGSYAICATYTVLLFRKLLRSRNVYRKLSFVIWMTAILTVLATVASVTRVSPFPHFTLLPLTYLGVGSLLLLGTTSVTFARRLPVDRALSLFRSRLDSTIPLARDFVMQEVDNGIVVLDPDDRVVDINATAKFMIGTERPIGKHLTDITRLNQVLDGDELLPILQGETPVETVHDQIWVESDSGMRCYDVRISALTEGDAASTAHVILLHDITDQKEREEQLQRQKETLETQKTQLEHQNERLDEFASIVSHDLRNPLSVAAGRTELMLVDADDTESVTVERDHLVDVRDAHERMASIIDDALTLARQGKAITDTEPVLVEAVARTAWENVSTRTASLTVTCNRTVEADRARLLTVFENLYRNSLEHGLDDVTVTVGNVQREGETGFFVADDGPGIPDSEKDDVLERGYTTSPDGTGLGLSIVTDVVTAHGWSITVTDSVDAGARFEITGLEQPGTETPAGD
ncbi:histidine kinase N-terminal 7TM domain-containing protein [Halorientalis brevis]|uniref:histidine kinase n=1 Tax=Halorientalis brevis TaxID=1126241 RepID=A0ABD6C6U0_9EURY|nr:histidine kinase N-terminal 7TM domain-containing protein [Halorientalis brevis]